MNFKYEIKSPGETLAKFEEEAFFAATIDPEWGIEIQSLWKDESIQKAYLRRNEFQLNDSANYFVPCLFPCDSNGSTS